MDAGMMDRTELPESSKWNVEAMYPKRVNWEEELELFQKQSSQNWTDLVKFQGNLSKGPGQIKDLLNQYFTIERKLMKLYIYAHLKHDEDVAHEVHKGGYDRISLLLHDFSNAVSWVEPEILSLDDAKLREYLQSPELAEYHTYLQKIVRMKPHTLAANEEQLLALSGNALDTSHKAYGVFANADLKFEPAVDAKGGGHELSLGKYNLYSHSKDRTLRKSSFKNIHQGFGNYANTICELLSGQMQAHLYSAKARHFPSCLDAALFPHQIDTKVYHSLIEAVRKNLPVLHRYVSVRKKHLGVEELHAYDLNVPMVKDFEMKVSYDEAVAHILDSIKPLGEAYVRDLQKGLVNERWVDVFETPRKRSGAYSSGSYDTMPYILMNFHGTARDLSTLTHEAGHSMHSLLSRRSQPYQYASYPIFVAEVASTFNEELLFRHLLANAKDKNEKLYLINSRIDDIRSTLFRQAMFAEFELKLHQMAEENSPLTYGNLRKIYLDLNKEYYGPELVLDDELGDEFLRVPHFYYNFYVYQYATGVSAAFALAERVLAGGENEKKAYLNFLSSGCSKYPIEVLADAGVDMTTPKPVEALIRYFDQLVKEFDKLSNE